MAIKFSYRGIEYTADTPEEADRLRLQLEDTDYKRAKDDPAFRDRLNKQIAGWTDEKFWRVVNALGEQQTRFITAIYQWTTIEDVDLATVLKLPSKEALAGVVSGLSKQLTKIKIKPSEIFRVETHWVGKKKKRYFYLSTGFDGAAAEFKWSHHWRLEQWAKEMYVRIDKMKKDRGKKNKKLIA